MARNFRGLSQNEHSMRTVCLVSDDTEEVQKYVPGICVIEKKKSYTVFLEKCSHTYTSLQYMLHELLCTVCSLYSGIVAFTGKGDMDLKKYHTSKA